MIKKNDCENLKELPGCSDGEEIECECNCECDCEASDVELSKLESEIPTEEEMDSLITAAELESVDRGSLEALKVYATDIAKIKKMSAKELRELEIKMARGDKDARDQLIEQTLKLAIYAANRKFRPNTGIDLEDLIQVATLGIFKAADHYKDNGGRCKFSTYAMWWIQTMLQNYVNENSSCIRIPKNTRIIYKRYYDTKEELESKLGREPEMEEICSAMGYVRGAKAMANILERVKEAQVVSLDAKINVTDGTEADTFHEIIGEEDNSAAQSIASEEIKEAINQMFHELKLSLRDRRIFELSFGISGSKSANFSEIVKILDEEGLLEEKITKERVRQVYYEILGKARNNHKICKLMKPLWEEIQGKVVSRT